MSYGLVYVFEGVTEEQYWAVNEKLGIGKDGSGDWPQGLIAHSGGPLPDGGWTVIERWDSKASQEAFMATRLGAALGAVNVAPPVHVYETETVNDQYFG